MATESESKSHSQPSEATNTDELLELIKTERKRIICTLYQPHLVSEMKANIAKVSDALKYSIDKAAMLIHTNTEGMSELCPEISKYISLLTIAVKVINYDLCECAANDLLKATIKVFDSIHKFFENKNKNNLTLLVGIIWENLKNLKSIPLNNTTAIGRQILQTLTVIRDAKKELKQSIKDWQSSECIQVLNPYTFDSQRMAALQCKANDCDSKNEIELTIDESCEDLMFIGSEERELSELESLRVYQISECILFVDEVINHFYLFILKHFKETNSEDRDWLQKCANEIGKLPLFVDELCCVIYLPNMSDESVRKNASNLLHFLWKIAIEIGEESLQFKNRKMVLKNGKKMKKCAMNGYEWKCKFVDLNLKIGAFFGLLQTMDCVNEFIENDSHYRKHKNKRKQKKDKKHRKNKNRKKIRKAKRKHTQKRDNNSASATVSASSQKERESANNTTENSINIKKESESDKSEEIIDID